MTLARPAFALVPVFFGAGLLLECRGAPLRRRIVPVAVLVLGFCLIMVPWIYRNNTISGGASGVRVMTGGWQLYVSAQQYTGEVSCRLLHDEWVDIIVPEFNQRNQQVAQGMPDGPYRQALIELEVERSYLNAAGVKFKEVNPAQLLPNSLSRIYWLWSTSDVSPWQTGPFHRFVQAYHVLLAALGVLGLVLSRGFLLRQWPLWMFAVYQTLLHLVYHVEGRFTWEGRLFLCIYAGASMDWVLARLQATGATDAGFGCAGQQLPLAPPAAAPSSTNL
jgi:hypothetical protein